MNGVDTELINYIFKILPHEKVLENLLMPRLKYDTDSCILCLGDSYPLSRRQLSSVSETAILCLGDSYHLTRRQLSSVSETAFNSATSESQVTVEFGSLIVEELKKRKQEKKIMIAEN
jgi:hypothetical protein